jgi:alkylation response protein AidB-like acyl-CoA dehydrogenase
MDFSLTDEQRMLLDTTERLIAKDYTFEHRREIRESAAGYSRAIWQQFAALGLLALNIPEDEGGLGAGAVSTMLVSNAIGGGLVLEPFLSSAVVATYAIAQLASPDQRSMWLPKLAAGELIAVLAHDEISSRFDFLDIETRAVASNDGWCLSGRKAVVYHAPAAGLLLISARVDTPKGRELGLFAVPATNSGITLTPCATVDSQRAADIALNQVQIPATARIGGDIGPKLSAVLDYGLAALCGEAVGALDKLLAATIDYTRTRVQFGVPIARFQALQHRMADMLLHVEQARSMSYLAASSCVAENPAQRRAAMSAAKVIIGQAARFVGQQAIQLHGGMGMTDELSVSHYFKRLLAIELRFGSTDAHLDLYTHQLQTA